MYHPTLGVINHALARAGLGPVDWLGDPRIALVALMIVSPWATFGAQMTVFLAGLAAIPRAYLDAARVDGANAWQGFWRVTLPLLRPVTVFVLVTGIIGACQMFALVMVLTGGGPLGATDVVVSRLVHRGWEQLEFGDASVLALVRSGRRRPRLAARAHHGRALPLYADHCAHGGGGFARPHAARRAVPPAPRDLRCSARGVAVRSLGPQQPDLLRRGRRGAGVHQHDGRLRVRPPAVRGARSPVSRLPLGPHAAGGGATRPAISADQCARLGGYVSGVGLERARVGRRDFLAAPVLPDAPARLGGRGSTGGRG